MGMFDNLHYQGHEYQTKDTPAQMLDNYKIEQDQISGLWYLWHEEYDSEWQEDGGFFGGHLKQYNQRWVRCDNFDGVVDFYRSADNTTTVPENWIEYHALFMDGRLLKIHEKITEPLTKWYLDGLEQTGIK